MSYVYANQKQTKKAAPSSGKQTVPGPSLDALRTGQARPSAQQLGRRVDLPGAIQAKMENAFGADLSGVKLYESQTVADAGASAMSQGNTIAFAPGKLDLASQSGQALLGHELSHVVSQARGEVSGSGFLNDHALEARADREGAMAAAGKSVYSGPVTAPLSAASAAPAAGPMQAKKSKTAAEKAAYYRKKRDTEKQKYFTVKSLRRANRHKRRADKYLAKMIYWGKQAENDPPSNAGSTQKAARKQPEYSPDTSDNRHTHRHFPKVAFNFPTRDKDFLYDDSNSIWEDF